MLEENLECELLGNPETRIMDSEWFYDSNFHLNDSGTIVYTKQLIQDIKALFDDYTPINIEFPNKPIEDDSEDNASGKISEDFNSGGRNILIERS